MCISDFLLSAKVRSDTVWFFFRVYEVEFRYASSLKKKKAAWGTICTEGLIRVEDYFKYKEPGPGVKKEGRNQKGARGFPGSLGLLRRP